MLVMCEAIADSDLPMQPDMCVICGTPILPDGDGDESAGNGDESAGNGDGSAGNLRVPQALQAPWYVWPNARVYGWVYGCHLRAAGCDHIFDGMQTVQTAADVQMVTLIAMSIGATTFLSTGLRLVLSRDVRVQAAPAVGEVTGLTVRGTF
jgi:hypothetical protein